MMKKTYINPEMQVVKINAPQLLAGSEIPTGDNWSSGGIQARELDFFDDEDFDF